MLEMEIGHIDGPDGKELITTEISSKSRGVNDMISAKIMSIAEKHIKNGGGQSLIFNGKDLSQMSNRIKGFVVSPCPECGGMNSVLDMDCTCWPEGSSFAVLLICSDCKKYEEIYYI